MNIQELAAQYGRLTDVDPRRSAKNRVETDSLEIPMVTPIRRSDRSADAESREQRGYTSEIKAERSVGR